MKKLTVICAVCSIVLVLSNPAKAVSIDLSGASTGTMIIAPGGSFASLFAGQVPLGGSGVSGSPTGPLTLAPTYILDVDYWNGSNSILPQDSGNAGPLSLLLDMPATSISWTMGYADSQDPITIDFFDLNGSLVQSVNQPLTLGYNNYSFGGFGSFNGLTIYNNTDPAGLRFQNFEYVPEPATIALFSLGYLILRKKS
ncbi:MAG: PEP-CTERM sorting domain-containing protein [Sedimentisphaerales bacterium]|nr:PEP-CTERM sorting domain-containing protein [Sedimentisphaerales bacterium]